LRFIDDLFWINVYFLGGEPLRLPDFLPTQAGSGNVGSSGNIGGRDELAEERRLRINAERELRAALQVYSLFDMSVSGITRKLLY
jgi:hypothetical protein